MQLGAIAVVAVILLVLAGILYINHRGQSEWDEFRTKWEAKGERFDYRDFVPATVPDEQNFAATPLLAALTDFSKLPGQPLRWNNPASRERVSAIGALVRGRGHEKAPPMGQWQLGVPIDLIQWQQFLVTNGSGGVTDDRLAAKAVLTVLKQFDAELDELGLASRRPHSQFPLNYGENFRMLLPHLASLKGIAQFLHLRAAARLSAGERQGASSDVNLTVRIAEALKTEPLLISQLTRIAMIQLAIQPVWEGIVRHQWSDAELQGIQATLSRVQVLDDYGRAIRGERAFGNAMLDELRTGKYSVMDVMSSGSGDEPALATVASRFIPAGWYRLNQVSLNELYQEYSLSLVDVSRHRVNVEFARKVDDVPELKERGIFNLFARLVFPAVGKAVSNFAHAQSALDLTRVACALERYRLKHETYPTQLDPLVPEFIDRIPVDVVNGEFPKYGKEADGNFVLSSGGWNLNDDGGEPGLSRLGDSFDHRKGDWVWRFPGAQ